ncbi:hypothetical protein [Ruminococcus flavefaciens]|uniref:hypothetical protein n=1 Tax=Ruminococcus flavefaciens TaxID=1265 RepID=UPI0026F21A35|nr:hypothetical protein [Ruminococcus flavefaciens]
MLNISLITMFILAVPIIIPLMTIGIVKMCDSKNTHQNYPNFNYPPQNGFYGYPQSPYQAAQMPQPPKPKKKHDMTVSNVLFLIGTAFVVLSGLAFGVAKWVNTSHEGRVAIIMAASLVSFTLSAVVGKFLKLNGTSTSFYVLGSGFIATAVLTAGFYKLMGEWLSLSGDGKFALLAISTGISAVMMFIGDKLFKKLPLIYTALSAAALTILFAVLQISNDFMVTAPIFLVLQTLITAAIYAANLFKGKKNEFPIKFVGSCSAFIYGCFPAAYIFSSLRQPTFISYIILAIIIVQLLCYAKKTKEEVFSAISSMVTVLFGYMASTNIAEESKARYGILVFAVLSIVLYVIHRLVPLIKNRYTESITLLTSVISAFVCISTASKGAFITEMILALIVSVFIAAYIFHKNEIIQNVAGFIAPVLPAFVTEAAIVNIIKTYNIKNTDMLYSAAWSIFAAGLIAAAVLIAYLPKYAFNFHAKHPRSNDIVLYVNMVASGLLLILIPSSKALVIIPAVISFIHFAFSNKLRCNITAVLSPVAFISCIHAILDEGTQSNLFSSIVFMTVFCIFMAISKLIYNDGIIVRANDRLMFDPMLLSGWLAVMMMYRDTTRTSAFFFLIGLAIYLACFIKKNTSRETAAILLTATSSLTALALMIRPFFVPESKAVSWKISIGIVVLVGVACRYIWREFPNASRFSSNSIFLTSFIALLIDAMYFDTAANTIFVMSVMFFVLVTSIMARSKTWFIASAASLFTITIYATREYLMALNWWIYLFLAGITLIALAAGNEYCKKNNQTLRSSVAKRFSGWTW